MDYVGIITGLIQSLQEPLARHGEIIVAVSVLMFGENAALAIFALSAKGFINPVTAFIWAFIGSLASDIFWFFVTEHILRKRFGRYFETKGKTNRLFMHLTENYFFWTLIFIKFLAGIRLMLTIYIVIKNRIPFSTKVTLDAIGTVIFMSVLFPIGWYLGKGVSSALSIQQNITYVLSVVVGVLLITVVAPKVALRIFERFHKIN
jgi:membrane protein DedA with SNARE-associated domain